jgi:hypothetical protein
VGLDIRVRLDHIYITWNNKTYLKHSNNVTYLLLSAGKNKSSWHLHAGFVSSIVFNGLHNFSYSTTRKKLAHTRSSDLLCLLRPEMSLWQGAMSITLKASVHIVRKLPLCFNRKNCVGILSGRPGYDPGNAKIILSFTASKPALRPIQPPTQWVPGIKRLRREADHSYSSSASVKSGGPISPLPHTSSRHDA